MAAVVEHERVAALRRLGLSEPLIRLSCGDLVHPEFEFNCLGPPYYVYHDAVTPAGPPLIPLWDHNDTVVGVWEQPDGPEFIEFNIEAEDEVWPQGRTEQGFWATRFDFLYESEVGDEDLREAAAVVGFHFLDRLVASREAFEGGLGTFEDHEKWLRAFVVEIDAEAARGG